MCDAADRGQAFDTAPLVRRQLDGQVLDAGPTLRAPDFGRGLSIENERTAGADGSGERRGRFRCHAPN